MKDGKNFASSSGSSSWSFALMSDMPAVLTLALRTWIDLERLTISDRFCKAYSSMVPIELKTK